MMPRICFARRIFACRTASGVMPCFLADGIDRRTTQAIEFEGLPCSFLDRGPGFRHGPEEELLGPLPIPHDVCIRIKIRRLPASIEILARSLPSIPSADGIECHTLEVASKSSLVRIVFKVGGNPEETHQHILKNVVRILRLEPGVSSKAGDD